jgi:hypothetical protein
MLIGGNLRGQMISGPAQELHTPNTIIQQFASAGPLIRRLALVGSGGVIRNSRNLDFHEIFFE